MSEKNIYLLNSFLKNHFFQLSSIIILLLRGFFYVFLPKIFFIIFNLKKIIIFLLTVFIIRPVDFFFFIYLFFNDNNNVLFSKTLSTKYSKINFFHIYCNVYKLGINESRILFLLFFSEYKKKNIFLRQFINYYFFNILIFFFKKETFFFSNKDSFKWKFNFLQKKQFGFYKNNTEIKNFTSKRKISFKELDLELKKNRNILKKFLKNFLTNNSHYNFDYIYNFSPSNKKKIFYKKKIFKDKINSITLNKIKYKPLLIKYYKAKNLLYKNIFFKLKDDFFFSNNDFISHEAVKLKNLNYYGYLKKYIYHKFGNEMFRFNKKKTLPYIVPERDYHNKKVIFSNTLVWSNYFHYIFEIVIPNYYLFIKNKKKLDVVMNFPFSSLKSNIEQIFQNKIIDTNRSFKNFYKTGICGNFINKFDNYHPSLACDNDVIYNQLYINKKAANIFREKVIGCSKNIKFNKNLKKTAFITRSSSYRNLLNYNHLKYAFSNEIDFYSLEYESLFSQAKIFNSYNKIISPIGSGLTNIIFCKPNTEILVLLPKSNSTFFHFWQYIADISKVNISYIEGETNSYLDIFSETGNSNYFINLNKINDFIV